MADKQIIKQLAERYKEICRSPFADGYTFTAFDGECAKKGFTRDDIKNYIEKEKQERKAKRTESIKSLKEQLKRKEQECDMWKKLTVDNGAVALKYQQQLDQLKAENETLFKAIEEVNKINKRLKSENDKLKEEKQGLIKDWEEKKNLAYEIACKNEKLKQTLTEIKEALQFYNNTTIGLDKGNGFFEIEVPKGNYSKFIYYYDTNPAKEALQKISEVEDV